VGIEDAGVVTATAAASGTGAGRGGGRIGGRKAVSGGVDRDGTAEDSGTVGPLTDDADCNVFEHRGPARSGTRLLTGGALTGGEMRESCGVLKRKVGHPKISCESVRKQERDIVFTSRNDPINTFIELGFDTLAPAHGLGAALVIETPAPEHYSSADIKLEQKPVPETLCFKYLVYVYTFPYTSFIHCLFSWSLGGGECREETRHNDRLLGEPRPLTKFLISKSDF
jgi:hypothetical protein